MFPVMLEDAHATRQSQLMIFCSLSAQTTLLHQFVSVIAASRLTRLLFTKQEPQIEAIGK